MDWYRTWFCGLKRALLYRDDQTLHSTINIAATTLSRIPEGLRDSTFIGQPGLLEILSNLQRALESGRNTDELKTALSDQVRLWERTKSISIPAVLPVSLPSSPSPPASESSYGSAESVDLATRQTRASSSAAGGHYQGILAPVPANVYDLPLATFLQQQSGPVPGDRFVVPCEKCSKRNRVSIRARGPSCLECMPFRNAVGRAVKTRNNDFSENLATEMKKYNADRHNGMGKEGHLTQILTDQQLLAVKYQELGTLVDLLQEREDEWTRKLAQDTNWKIAVDGKLETILNLLDRSLRIGPSQTDNLRLYFGPNGSGTFPIL